MTGKHLFTSEQKLEIWGIGEWVEELDEFHWEYQGIKCEVHRNATGEYGCLSGMGQLNGYIILPRNHPWEQLDYDKIDAVIHGGVTASSLLEDGSTRIGFDCAHFDDETPYTAEKGFRFMLTCTKKDSEKYFMIREMLEKFQDLNKYMACPETKTYKNIEFVKCECEYLVQQALAVQLAKDIEQLKNNE
jgi:hypothetical protein